MTDPLGLVNSGGGTAPVAPRPPASPTGPDDGAHPNFRDVLMQNIEQVNTLQKDAEMAIEDLMTGRRDDAAAVMIAKQKADVAFQLLMQVRNKLVDAYDEIKQMRV
jgi:flagellar hook-basal body complex protein FliE